VPLYDPDSMFRPCIVATAFNIAGTLADVVQRTLRLVAQYTESGK
jgi:hypothetical protein